MIHLFSDSSMLGSNLEVLDKVFATNHNMTTCQDGHVVSNAIRAMLLGRTSVPTESRKHSREKTSRFVVI